MKSRGKFINNTIMLYIMTAAKYVFPLIALPYLTRVFGPELYGVVIYMTATVNYFQLLMDFGFNFSSTKEIAENSHDSTFISNVLGSVIQAKTILLLLSIVILTAIIPVIAILRENILLAYLYLASVGINILLPDFLFRGLEEMSIITYRFILAKLISTVLTFVLVRSKQDVTWVPILSILGSIAAILLTWRYIKSKLQIKPIFQSINTVIKTLKDSWVYFLATFATTAFGATNAFVLGAMALPSQQIAFWGVCYQLISAVQSLYNPITSSLYPHMVAKKDFRLAKRILYVLMPVILVGTALAYLLSDIIISIIAGKQYLEAVPVFRALLPVLIFSFPAQIIGFPVMGVIGLVKETTTTTVIASVFHIVCLGLLILMGWLTVLSVAILRSISEAMLLFGRVCFIYKNRKTLRC